MRYDLRPLLSGKVLGLICVLAAGPLQDSDRKDPGMTVASSWSKLPNLPAKHNWGYGASLWKGDQLYLFHYQQETELPSITAFDPKAKKWTFLPEAPQEGAGRGRMTIPPPPVAVLEERAYFPRQNLSFDFKARKWQKLPKAPVVCQHAVSAGNRVYACGFEGEDFKSRFSAAVYDPEKNSWELLAERRLEVPFQAQGLAWTGRKALIWGTRPPAIDKARGDAAPLGCLLDAVAYDPERKVWETPTGMPHQDDQSRRIDGSVWTGDRIIYLGEAVHGVKGACRNDGLIYDLAAGTWTSIPPAPLKGRSGSALAWTGKKLVVWSGVPCSGCEGRKRSCSDGAAFDPASGEWAGIPDAPIPGMFPPCVAWAGDRIIVYGGYGDRFVRAGETAWYVWPGAKEQPKKE